MALLVIKELAQMQTARTGFEGDIICKAGKLQGESPQQGSSLLRRFGADMGYRRVILIG